MKSFDEAAFDRFFSSATRSVSPPLVPQLRLRVAEDLPTLWDAQEQWFDCLGMPPPYWGVAWPGGQALARFLLDNPEFVRGRSVLDLGSGCGICAIAASLSGGRVHAVDVDPAACHAVARNAALNATALTVSVEDAMSNQGEWDVVLAADLWYERFMAGKVTSWLRGRAGSGACVLLGDLGRAFFPRLGVIELDRFPVEASAATEKESLTMVRVWQLLGEFCVASSPS
jgi:predicted nicotinamide N-methyase